jgi:Polyketide cyclase / dehydrase and lipid transport
MEVEMLTALIIVAFLIVVFLVIAALRPDDFSVVRSADIKAPPDKVFAQVNSFKNWGTWSPWEKMDPNLKREFSGPESGVGATYAWVGNKKVGEGRMEITRSVPSSNMQLDLQFIKPFKADNITEFTLTPNDGGTDIKWEMRGKLNFMMKAMQMFFSMDKVVGKDFEAGLANLKGIVER